jgi:UDP-N-acetylglucosamine 1-carboxyvinyltransferase
MTTLLMEGSQRPSGRVCVSGAKNSALCLLAAAALSRERVRLGGFPTDLVDAREQIRFMTDLGAALEVDDVSDTVDIRALEFRSDEGAAYDHAFRVTYLYMASQIARTGRASIPYPGGCRLGDRKHDIHLDIWRRMGLDVREEAARISAEGRLRGASIELPISTVGGTENALLCGAAAQGLSVIRNAYVTPEVRDLIDLLIRMGARIEWRGGRTITLEGRPEGLDGAVHTVMPDRIEAMTWIIYAALSGGRIAVSNVAVDDLQVPLIHLKEAGIDAQADEGIVQIGPESIHPEGIQPFDVACGAHPGVHTDMQPFFVLLALGAEGRSLVVDYRYPDRVAYLAELQKMVRPPGALAWADGRITIAGPQRLRGAPVEATDLRGGMALVLAALLAEGPSEISRFEMVLRGYNRLLAKLRGLGLTVTEIPAQDRA